MFAHPFYHELHDRDSSSSFFYAYPERNRKKVGREYSIRMKSKRIEINSLCLNALRELAAVRNKGEQPWTDRPYLERHRPTTSNVTVPPLTTVKFFVTGKKKKVTCLVIYPMIYLTVA